MLSFVLPLLFPPSNTPENVYVLNKGLFSLSIADNYLKEHPSRDISKIKEDIDKTIKLKNSKVETNKKAILN
ncbi:MAG: hypothetical protein E7J33_04385, partial [Peptostreptococcaceae bacterium]|nr:hypothetical protein [Peptostreptococcaceae bacterium]